MQSAPKLEGIEHMTREQIIDRAISAVESCGKSSFCSCCLVAAYPVKFYFVGFPQGVAMVAKTVQSTCKQIFYAVHFVGENKAA